MAKGTIMMMVPAKSDVLGDYWATRVREIFERACEEIKVPLTGDGMGAVWNLFQYTYCEVVGMKSRIIASPQAMLMCGWKVTEEHLQLAERLMQVQGDILEREAAKSA